MSSSVPEDKAIYKHAFWLYGIIVGLAIKDLLEYSLPHLIHYTAEVSTVRPHPTLGTYPEIVRFATALFLMIRFYLGSAFYFGLAHESETANEDFEKRNFGTDFVLGILHFLGFVILSMTVDMHRDPVFAFPSAVAFVLLYDVFWYLFTFKLDTSDLIKWWALLNSVTVFLAGLLYFAVYTATRDLVTAEIWALWVVFIVTILDLGFMMAKKPFFEPIEAWAIRRKGKKT